MPGQLVLCEGSRFPEKRESFTREEGFPLDREEGFPLDREGSEGVRRPPGEVDPPATPNASEQVQSG